LAAINKMITCIAFGQVRTLLDLVTVGLCMKYYYVDLSKFYDSEVDILIALLYTN